MSTSSEPAGAGLVESSKAKTGLGGHMGVMELVFTVVAYNGPVVVFLGFLPVAILLGNGVGTPVAILVAGVVVALLAVGLLTMAMRLDKPGGFYALITAGLGRIAGLGAGFTALTCYFVALISVYALGGIALDTAVQTIFNGPAVDWWIYALGMLVLAGVIGYRNINLSAKVLTVFLGCELLLMAAYDISVLVQGGPDGIGFDSFSPDSITSGSISVAFLFAVGLFGGFEATVIFRDEVRDPHRTIPRATYGVIALLAGMYALTAWCLINSYGAAVIMDVVTDDLVGAASNSVKDYLGTFAYDIATIMLFTSAFALVIAAHNITSRYLYNLAADGIFPRALGEAHPRHISPHRASVVLSGASLIVLTVLIIAKMDEATLYARFAGLYSYAFLMLLVLVSLAVGVYLLRDKEHGQSPAQAVLAFVAFLAFALGLFLATKNFTLLSGATGSTKTILLILIWGVTVAGFVIAAVLRRSRPEIYSRIGRQ